MQSALHPAVLFGDERPRSKARASVVSLVGLPTLGTQRTFLNQLAMILFSWIKKHPNPPSRALRGLLVVDEAKDLLPAPKATECKEGTLRLGSWARKYGLGPVLATQHPKDLEHKPVGNSATHFDGLNNSPASLATVHEQMRLKGGRGADIARLEVGPFHIHSADPSPAPPAKPNAPGCPLSKRRLGEHEALAKAGGSRARVEGQE